MARITTRNSSIELLRIIAMLSIVSVHYWSCLKTQQNLKDQGFSYEIFLILNQLMEYGVNIFVIITGYYMATAKSISIRKAFDLLWDIALYGSIMFFISIAIGINSFSLSGLIKSIFPIMSGLRWFVKAYIILYLLIPFINKVLQNITSKQHLILIGILLALFSFWPFILPNPPMDDYGFSYNHFIVLYIIASFFRLHKNDVPLRWSWTIFIISSLLIWGLIHLNISLPIFSTMKTMALAHNCPIKIAASFSIFLIFNKYNWHNKSINILAASAFSVYVIHGDFNIMQWMFETLFHGKEFQQGWGWIFHWGFTIIMIYLICFVINNLVKKTIGTILCRIFDKVAILNLKIKVN